MPIMQSYMVIMQSYIGIMPNYINIYVDTGTGYVTGTIHLLYARATEAQKRNMKAKPLSASPHHAGPLFAWLPVCCPGR